MPSGDPRRRRNVRDQARHVHAHISILRPDAGVLRETHQGGQGVRRRHARRTDEV